MIVEKMLELQILTGLLELTSHISGDRFEFEGNLYRKTEVEIRHRELFKEFIEPYMLAQSVEVVDITEKSE